MRRLVTSLLLAPVAFIALALLAVGLGWIAIHLTQSADLGVVRFAAGHRSSTATFVMHRLSDLAGENSVIIIVAASALLFLAFRHVVDALAVIASAAGMLFLYELVVRWVGRPRPSVSHLENPGGSSFPSGHVANSTATYVAILLAVFLSARFPGARPPLIVLVTVLIAGIATARVYLGLHYPTDVAVGFLLGLCWALVVRRTLDGLALSARSLIRP
jgi:membrane-associated phospholipid phosphatase